MCGIIGVLFKQPELSKSLGQFVTPMVDCMGSRGPDSAGLAVFCEPVNAAQRRYSLYWQDSDQSSGWKSIREELAQCDGTDELEFVSNHATVTSSMPLDEFRSWLTNTSEKIHLLSTGRSIKVFKDEGLPGEIAARYHFSELSGTHAVGHTRMATESMVSPAHAHPYTAGEDFCLVHNGSLSNPNSVRRRLVRKGIAFETDNDTEAGCRFLEWRLSEGDTLEEAIEASFSELDGFFTFLMATADKMVLVRDAFCCKPAVAAETDEYVAVCSEFRGLAHLPGVQHANVFEPKPEEIYAWSLNES